MNTPLLSVGRDIFAPAGTFPVVVGHGVNIKGVMGAGFAKLVSDRFPKVKSDYQRACMDGSLTTGHTQLLAAYPSLFIANIASQDHPGPYARLDWLRQGLDNLYFQLSSNSVNTPIIVRLPLIGAGIGGLDPIEAADTIFNAAGTATANVSTELCLLKTDAHTVRVEAHYRDRFVS